MLQIITALFVFVSAGGLSIWALKRILALEGNLKRDDFEKLCRMFSAAAAENARREHSENRKGQTSSAPSSALDREVTLWVDAVVSTFISSWTSSYCGPSSTVENDMSDALSTILRRLVSRMKDLDPREVSSIFAKIFHTHLLRYSFKTGSETPTWLHHMTGNSNQHLQSVTQALLVHLDGDELINCELGLKLVAHLLVSNVFHPAFSIITDPTFLNKAVVYSLVSLDFVKWNLEEELKKDKLLELPSFDVKKLQRKEEEAEENKRAIPLPNCKRTLTTALGKALQATAGPILPQNLQFSSFPLMKLWPSPTKKPAPKRKFLKKSYSFDYSIDALPVPVTVTESASISNIRLDCERLQESVDEDSFSLKTSSLSSSPNSAKESSVDLSNKDLSPDPEYEDFPDMETAISKLRAMLAQKSSADQSVSSQESLDSPKIIPEKQPLLVEPVLLDNISIIDTETKKDFSNNPYTLYCIRYDVYHWPIKVLESGERVGDPNGMELRRAVVKRRFREFLNFQMRLESNPKLRCAMRGLKGPSKWVNSPFGKNEESTVTARRQLLESFLEELCSKPGVCDSAEVLEFLGYGCEVAVEYVKKPSVVGANRLDKVLARTVSGMFQTLRTALPTFDHQDSSGSGVSLSLSLGSDSKQQAQMETIHSPVSVPVSLPGIAASTMDSPVEARSVLPNFLQQNSVNEQLVFSNYNFECLSREGIDRVESHLDRFLDGKTGFGLDVATEPSGKSSPIQRSRFVKESGRLEKGLTGQVVIPGDPDLDEWMNLEYEFSSTVADILCTCLRNGRTRGDDFRTREPGMHLLKLFVCPWLENQLVAQVDHRIGACEAWIKYLTALRWTLFGVHALDDEPGKRKDPFWAALGGMSQSRLEELAKKAVTESLTRYRTLLGGVEAVKELSSFIVGALQDTKMNEDVGLAVLDLVVSKLFV